MVHSRRRILEPEVEPRSKAAIDRICGRANGELDAGVGVSWCPGGRACRIGRSQCRRDQEAKERFFCAQGRPVRVLKDEGSVFSITFFEPELPQSHKVVEIGDNFVVVRDIAEITETLIPVYAVKAIVKVKTKPQ